MRCHTLAARLTVSLASLALLGGCSAGATPSPSSTPTPTPTPALVSPSISPPPTSPQTASPPPTPASAAWHATGKMIVPHAYHTATVLPDGRVLVAGGLVNDRLDGKVSDAAELYDPSSGTWTATEGMIHARWGQTATPLGDGKVLVAGSYVNSGEPLASAELYDSSTGRWIATGNMNMGRGGHTATRLLDGTVLVVGGGAEDTQLEGGPRSATAELYDPRTGEWTATGNMIEARQEFTATLLPDGWVLVAGGDGGFTAAELYDPVTGRWTATGSMADGRIGHTATLLSDGMVLVTGGCACSEPGAGERATAERYDPGTGRWTATGSMGTARIFHTATLLVGGTVLVVDDGLYDTLASAELYGPGTGRWTATVSPTVSRVGYTTTLLLDGRALVTGDYSHNSRTAELYDPGVGS